MKLFLHRTRYVRIIPAVFLCGLMTVLAGAGWSAQEKEVVEIQTFLSRDGVHAGKTFKFALKAEIAPTWHIHAHELSDEFLIPTNIVLEETEGLSAVEVFYPEPELKKYDYSDVKLKVYEGESVFGVYFETKSELSTGSYIIKGKFKFQACDHSSCLPPKGLDFEIEINIVDSSQETKAINQEIFTQIKFKKD